MNLIKTCKTAYILLVLTIKGKAFILVLEYFLPSIQRVILKAWLTERCELVPQKDFQADYQS